MRLKPLESSDVRCDECKADLVVIPKYLNLVVLLWILVAYLGARSQHQSGIELVMTLGIISGVFIIVGAPLVAPFLPKELIRERPYLDALDLQLGQKK